MQPAYRFTMSGLPLFRLFGIQIRVHVSLLLIVGLIILQLGATGIATLSPMWSNAMIWAIASAAGVGFFVSVLLHEMGHAAVARRKGLEVVGVTLFLFGGMAHVRGAPPSPRAELGMAFVGPLINLAIGLVSTVLGGFLAYEALEGATSVGDVPRAGPVATLLLWLGPANLLLAAFNLLPGFPLDGGRVLRAIFWRATGDIDKSTRWAANAGKGVASLLIVLGASMAIGLTWPILGGGLAGGLWLILVGWFLYGAALSSHRQVALRRALGGIPVLDLIHGPIATVDSGTHLETIVQDALLATDQRVFPVVDGDRTVGVISIDDVRAVPKDEWSRVTAADVMRPLSGVSSLGPGADASDALEALAQRDTDHLPVVDGDRLLGFVRRADVLRLLYERSPALPA